MPKHNYEKTSSHSNSMPMKEVISIPLDILPEARNWKIGKMYRVRMVLKQVGTNENAGEFEIIDASSLENDDKTVAKFFMSDGGSYKSV